MSAAIPDAGRLTRTLLGSLPSGTYLVSNCLGADLQPVYRAQVVAAKHRHRQWRMIRMAGAAGRKCHVFPSVEAYLASDFARAVAGGAR